MLWWKSDEKKREALREHILRERQEIMMKLEQERKSKIITLIHRREPWIEWMEGGHGILIEDSEKILMAIHQTPKDMPIDIILHTPGGLVLATEMIASALKKHPARVTAIVPFYAMSGGTMIALAADEIVMEEFSVLGPLDPQINGMASGAILDVVAKKPIASVSEDMLIMADLAEKAIIEVKSYIDWFLESKQMSSEEREGVARFLVGGFFGHSRPLSIELLRGLKLPVKIGVPKLVFDIFSTCEFGASHRPQIAPFLW